VLIFINPKRNKAIREIDPEEDEEDLTAKMQEIKIAQFNSVINATQWPQLVPLVNSLKYLSVDYEV
jgi:hypothetical protein